MFSERLRKLRLENGYTMEEVGRKIGIKKSSYASYESKYRQPPLEKLKSLSKFYGVTVDYILGLSDERNIEEACQNKFRQLIENKELHWNGQEIPVDVLLLIENVLTDTSVRRMDEGKVSGE